MRRILRLENESSQNQPAARQVGGRTRRARADAANEPEAGPLTLCANILGNQRAGTFHFFPLTYSCSKLFQSIFSISFMRFSLTGFHSMGFNFLNVNLFVNIGRSSGTFPKVFRNISKMFRNNSQKMFQNISKVFWNNQKVFRNNLKKCSLTFQKFRNISKISRNISKVFWNN